MSYFVTGGTGFVGKFLIDNLLARGGTVYALVRESCVPVIGMKTFGMEDADLAFRSMDRLWHLVLPSALSAVGGIAVLSRYVRSQMLEVVGGWRSASPWSA